MFKQKKLIVANWKMNPQTLKEAREIFDAAKKTAGTLKKSEVVVCPPFVYLPALAQGYKGKRLLFGGQDCFWEEKGAYTGEISPKMLKESGIAYCIVGHSERRALGENNEIVNKKILAALKTGLMPILCVGERERDQQGNYFSFIAEELREGFCGVSRTQLLRAVIAYEPIWAIGKEGDQAATPRDMHEMGIFIKKTLVDIYKTKQPPAVRILYGGSVDAGNAAALVSEGETQGLLVGHKSLNAKEFSEIMKHVDAI